jgi:hypothetical protein
MTTTTSVAESIAFFEKVILNLRALESVRMPAKATKPKKTVRAKSKKVARVYRPSNMNVQQKKDWPRVLKLLRAGVFNNRAIAKNYPSFSWTSIRSYRAHVTMRTYG